MRTLKHLPVNEWPEADRAAFRAAYAPGDLFDGTAGPGAHLAEGTRKAIEFTYRRWLAFLNANYPEDLSMPPAKRITPKRVRALIDHLGAQIGPSSVAAAAGRLYAAARLIAPKTNWAWLKSIKARLASRALSEDRFNRLVPPWQTLDYGIELMDTAHTLPIDGHKQCEIQYRDGLLLVLRSLWPIRRRSLAALTVSRHLEFDDAGVNILLHSADTKSRRAESFRVPGQLLPYLMRYLKDIRPALLGHSEHDGFWASYHGAPLSGDRLYDIVRARTLAKFGKAMSLHDFRRAAATFLAMDAPEKIGLIPGVLQHVKPEVSEQHYNLARSMQAGRRFAAHLANARKRLRPLSGRKAQRSNRLLTEENDHARGHLRPLLQRPTARGVDRGSDSRVREAHRARRMDLAAELS
jgi:integrase/recombinase XerD